MADGLTREFLNERDYRIFQMRKGGTSVSEIARRFGISAKAVNNAIQRQLMRMNAEAAMAYPELLRMELERLDALQQAIWPLTQHRKVEVNGEEVMLEPDQKAVGTVLQIMDKRARLLGMGQINFNIDTAASEAPVRAVLADAADRPAAVDEFDPETEALRLIELMLQAGVLPPEQAQILIGHEVPSLGPGNQDDDDEWEVLEDSEPRDDDEDGAPGEDDDGGADGPITPDEVIP